MSTPRRPWGPEEKQAWFHQQKIQRSYRNEVVKKIDRLREAFDVTRYGELRVEANTYPLFLIRSKNFDAAKKTVLITGGVHGYETSGVQGAIEFLQNHAKAYEARFNFVCTPCISPWGYETVNRWNAIALDPNRSFHPDSPADECRLFLDAMATVKAPIHAHFDLHETTDTDNTVFRLAKQERDAIDEELTPIPDGFYTVGDATRPQPAFQKAIIDSVRKVTQIAPPDDQGRLIGLPVESDGVIFLDKRKLFLCGGFSDAEYITTTEVYPDSPRVTPEICNQAQVAAVRGGLDYLLEQSRGA